MTLPTIPMKMNITAYEKDYQFAGDVLFSVRTRAKISQVTLGKLMGKLKQEINNIETGKEGVGRIRALALAEVFGIRYYHFMLPKGRTI